MSMRQKPDMKVMGLVSFRVFPTHMGGQKGVADFYRHLQQQLAVVLAVSTDNTESREVRIEKLLYPNRNIYLNIFRINKLKRLAAKESAELLIAEHSYAGWMAWLLASRLKKPFIVHSHNIESKRF